MLASSGSGIDSEAAKEARPRRSQGHLHQRGGVTAGRLRASHTASDRRAPGSSGVKSILIAGTASSSRGASGRGSKSVGSAEGHSSSPEKQRDRRTRGARAGSRRGAFQAHHAARPRGEPARLHSGLPGPCLTASSFHPPPARPAAESGRPFAGGGSWAVTFGAPTRGVLRPRGPVPSVRRGSLPTLPRKGRVVARRAPREGSAGSGGQRVESGRTSTCPTLGAGEDRTLGLALARR